MAPSITPAILPRIQLDHKSRRSVSVAAAVAAWGRFSRLFFTETVPEAGSRLISSAARRHPLWIAAHASCTAPKSSRLPTRNRRCSSNAATYTNAARCEAADPEFKKKPKQPVPAEGFIPSREEKPGSKHDLLRPAETFPALLNPNTPSTAWL